MSLRKAFKTSPKLETEGVFFEVGNTRVRLARAGGANQRYNARLADYATKNQRALNTGALKNDAVMAALIEIYADTVVVSWETDVNYESSNGGNPNWKSGIDDGNGGIVPATRENIIAVFKELPDFFIECKNFAENLQYYREELLAGIVGKSSPGWNTNEQPGGSSNE